MTCKVYWIYDSSMTDFLTEGYVGITSKPIEVRHKEHIRKNPRINENTYVKELYSGTREECFNIEKKYRPKKKIGWNNAVGGSHGWKIGFEHSEEAKEKMKSAWTKERKTKASIFKAEQNRKLKGQKRPKQSESISGENNGMYGKNHSKDSREKMSKSRMGSTPWNKGKTQEYPVRVCPHCKKEGKGPNMSRYHFDNCKLVK